MLRRRASGDLSVHRLQGTRRSIFILLYSSAGECIGVILVWVEEQHRGGPRYHTFVFLTVTGLH